MRISSASLLSDLCLKRTTISIPPIIMHFAPTVAKVFFFANQTFSHTEVFIENT
jgi:hypothetical protein